jgi:methylase of polypeptide subunit release factors
MMKQTPATDLFNQTIFDLLPNDAKKILEIGTGSGAMANAYKNANPAVNYVGAVSYTHLRAHETG